MRTTILSMALMVLIGGADAFAQGSSSVSKNSGGGAKRRRRGDTGTGRSSPAARQRCAQREEPERSERSAEQGKRRPRPQDQEHLPRLLGRVLIADMGGRMPATMLRMIAVAAVCFCDGAFAVAAGQPRHAPASVQGSAISSQSMATLKATRRAKQNAVRTQAADRDAYVDPAAPYKANRLSSRGRPNRSSTFPGKPPS